MGRIDAIIPDSLETQFRIEVIKRFGGKKGDIQRGIQEAIKLWIDSKTYIIEKLKKRALSSITINTLKEVIDTLVIQGKAAIPALGDILTSRVLSAESSKHLLQAIRKLSTST